MGKFGGLESLKLSFNGGEKWEREWPAMEEDNEHFNFFLLFYVFIFLF